MIADYYDPALEGTNATFSCPPGLVLLGPTTSTCIGIGEWEPDPRQVKCSGKILFSLCYAIIHITHVCVCVNTRNTGITYNVIMTHVHTHTHAHTLTADCGASITVSNNSIIMISNSTLEGSTLQFSCIEGLLPSDVFTAMCFPNGSWTPDPTTHMCKAITSSGIEMPSLVKYQSLYRLCSLAMYECIIGVPEQAQGLRLSDHII